VFATIEGNTYGWWAQRAHFVLGTSTWPTSWVSVIPIAYVLAVVLLTSFVRIERARAASGRSVLVDFTLYRIASFRNGNFAAMIVSLGEFGIVFVLPLFLQTVLGYSAWQTGLLLLALSGGAFLAGGSAMHLTRRFTARRVVSAGLLFEAVAIASLGAVISRNVTWHVMSPLLFVYGIGVGLATAQLTSVVLGDVPIAQSGQASGIQSDQSPDGCRARHRDSRHRLRVRCAAPVEPATRRRSRAVCRAPDKYQFARSSAQVGRSSPAMGRTQRDAGRTRRSMSRS